jgi:ubiquitin-activating enzyme E1 C
VPGCKVTPHVCRIEELETSFYAQFKLVISGLDAIAPRRWINSTLCGLVQFDAGGDPMFDSVIPLIDGGTEGFKGQARVIFPMITACWECALDAFPPQLNFPLCTLAETPRLPEHCVEWASVLQWPEHRPDTKLDWDNPEHLQWVSGAFPSCTQPVLTEIADAAPVLVKQLRMETPRQVFKKAAGRAEEHGIEGVTYQLTMGVVKRIIPAVAS